MIPSPIPRRGAPDHVPIARLGVAESRLRCATGKRPRARALGMAVPTWPFELLDVVGNERVAGGLAQAPPGVPRAAFAPPAAGAARHSRQPRPQDRSRPPQTLLSCVSPGRTRCPLGRSSRCGRRSLGDRARSDVPAPLPARRAGRTRPPAPPSAPLPAARGPHARRGGRGSWRLGPLIDGRNT